MSLLEAVIAFVILAVVGVVCLDQSRGAAQLQRSSADWTRAVSRGDAALAEAIAAGAANVATASDVTGDAPDRDVTVQRRPWHAGVDVIEVAVALPNGTRYVTARLVPGLRGPSR